jgi:tRNA G18 (ribose-2'-O)-methylase SpoU
VRGSLKSVGERPIRPGGSFVRGAGRLAIGPSAAQNEPVTTKAGPHIIAVEDLSRPDLEPYRDQKDAWLRVQRDGGTGLGGLFIAEGEIVARELFASKFVVRSVLVTPTRLLSMQDAIEALPNGTPVYVAERTVAEQIVGFDMHRGVLALGDRGARPSLEAVVSGARCVLLLEGLSNHDNVGSLYRSLSALGPADAAVVLGPGCADPFYRKSLRVSMGHVLRIPTAWVDAWPADLGVLERAGFRTVALTPDPRAIPLSDAGLRCPPDRIALMLGAEGPGLTQAAMAAADLRVRIPMNEGVDSLNVGVSAAIALAGLCTPGRG